MSATMHSQTPHEQEASSINIEERFAQMEECMRKMVEEVENLHWEKEALRRKNTEVQDDAGQLKTNMKSSGMREISKLSC